MDSSNDDIPYVELQFSYPPEGVEPRKLKLSDFPLIEMEISRETIEYKPLPLSFSKWVFKESNWMHGYGLGEVWITDLRTNRTRNVTNLVIAIRHRERHNIRLAGRRIFNDWHSFVENSSCRMFSWEFLLDMIRTFSKRPTYYIKKYRKYGLDGDGPV